MSRSNRSRLARWLLTGCVLGGGTLGCGSSSDDASGASGASGGTAGSGAAGSGGTGTAASGAAGGSIGGAAGTAGVAGASGGAGGSGAAGGGAAGGEGGAPSAGAGGEGGASTGGAGGVGGGAGAGGVPGAAELLALTASCDEIGAGRYATDYGEPETIAVCGLVGAVFWHADMDIDCDGQPSAACNWDTDPSFLPQTSAKDSNGEFLDASLLPFLVIPGASWRFDYADHGIELGSVGAVVYQGRVEYGVFADQGPDEIIGEASYAMAERLGIDPDPAIGGTPDGVSYVIFTGPSGVVSTIEDHDEAIAVGEARAAQLVADNQ